MKTKIENLDNGEKKITVTLENSEFEKYHDKGFRKVQEFAEIDGFRKGNAPENLVVEKYGEMVVLEEMAHLVINDTYYPALIKENEDKKEEDKILPISNPKISITKIGKGSDFEYEATFAVLPKVETADYKKISKEESKKVLETELEELKKKDENAKLEDLKITTDKEVDEILENLRKARNVGSHIHEDGTVHNEGHEEGENLEKELEEETLPEFDDAFAQSFGDNFKTMEDLKNKIKENLALEKNAKLLDKQRNYILERLVNESKINLPEILVEDELEKMKATMKTDIERYGSTWDEYITHLNKTEEDLKKDWRETAEKRSKSQLILNDIAKKEKIEVSKDEIYAEALKILNQMPEANEDHVNSYVAQILLNEKVMKLLDSEMN
ncbi:MAG: trigger factor [Candidatus Nomurabacteria bacterium]